MDQVKVTESCLFMCIQLEQYGRGSEFVGSGHSIIASIKNVAGPILRELVFVSLKKTGEHPGRRLGSKLDSIRATALIKLKFKPKASDGRLISSIGVPTGMLFSELRTISAGFLSGGTSE